MRKLALLALAAAAVYGLTGCALTDYCNDIACTDRIAADLVTDDQALGCSSGGYGHRPGQNLAQRPVVDPVTGFGTAAEIWTAALMTPATTPGFYERAADNASNKCNSNCDFYDCPGAVPGGIAKEQAAAWEDLMGTQVFLGETQVYSPATQAGTYVLAGMKSLGSICDPATGIEQGGTVVSGTGQAPPPLVGWKTIRLNSLYTPNTGYFSCVGSGVDGLYGGPEGQLLGDGMSNGRLPNLKIDTVALDHAPGQQWGNNVRGVGTRAQKNFNQGGGWNTFWAITARAYEGRYELITFGSGGTGGKKTDGLADFLSGEPMRISMPNDPGYVVARGSVTEDGMIQASIESLGWGDREKTLSQPVVLSFSRDAKRFVLQGPDAAQREFVGYMVELMPHDRPFYFGGTIPELGAKIGPIYADLNWQGLTEYASGPADPIISGGRSR